MTLRPYASRPARLTAQLIVDLFVLTWASAWIWVAVQLHDGVLAVGTAGDRIRDGASGVAGGLRDAGEDASRVPVAGDALAAPLNSAGQAATRVADAGQQLSDAVTGAALPLAAALAAATVLPFVVPWILLRLRYARRAGAAAALSASPAGARLLALRALANAPAHRLTTLDADPVSAWAREDPDVISALAALELRQLGLRARARAAPPRGSHSLP